MFLGIGDFWSVGFGKFFLDYIDIGFEFEIYGVSRAGGWIRRGFVVYDIDMKYFECIVFLILLYFLKRCRC